MKTLARMVPSALGLMAAVLLSGTSATAAGYPERSCDKNIPPITSGYGVDGAYGMVRQTVPHPTYRDDIQVFLPAGKTGRSPVMFFIHGYGPDISGAYADFIRHTVSRGAIVVFAPYPMAGTMSNRYTVLWNGLVRATEVYANQMDLSHLAVVGHSFGGGAVPTIAYRSFAEKNWGTAGALAFSLAPWYTHELTNAQWASMPGRVVFATQVYDQDIMNDHRMAIHQFSITPGRTHLYMMVHSLPAGNCVMTAGHMLPVSRLVESVRIKQYAVYRPLDALTDIVFSGADSTTALKELGDQLQRTPGYQPLDLYAPLVTNIPQSNYNFPWDGRMNPDAGKPYGGQ